MDAETYLAGLQALIEAEKQPPTVAELEPALVQLGEAVEEAWQAIVPFAIIYCSDAYLRLICEKRKQRNWVVRFWDWLVR